MIAIVDNKDHFEPVIDMTSQDNLPGLTFSFVKILNREISAKSISYYEVFNVDFRKDLKASEIENNIVVDPLDPSKKEIPIKTIGGLSECIAAGKALTVNNNSSKESTALFPINCCQKIVGVLIIRSNNGSGLSTNEEEYVLKLLRILENLTLLLSKKEKDTLTGLLNRQSFEEKINQILLFYRSSFQRNSDKVHQACLALLDIDHFKKVNDTYGHLIGDEVLLIFAEIMKRSFRFTDFLFRFGGEEFLVLLNEITEENASLTLERFRNSIEEHPFPQVGKVTVSIGYVIINQADVPTTIIEKADQSLYYAKNSGRNRVCSYEQLIEEDKIKKIGYDSGDIELW